MKKFAVIGTSGIVEQFVSTAQEFDKFSLSAVYSRDYNRGREFGARFGCDRVHTDLDELGRDSEVDAVYIASPNSLHAAQAIKLMDYGKHILGEKPFASNSREVEMMIRAAKTNDVLLMEAMKTPFMPIIQNVKKNLHKIGKIRRAFFNFSQYSSSYDNFRNGIVENKFKPELSSGGLLDIGVYPLCAMLNFFGKPVEISAVAQFMTSGVDSIGTVTMKYADFIGDVHYSKVTDSLIPSEIQGEDGNIVINRISIGGSAKLQLRNGETIDLGTESKNFYYEIEEFLTLLENGKRESAIMSHQLSMDLINLLDEVRRQIGLVYPADGQ